MKNVILRTPKRMKSNSFSDALFRTHFFGRTFSDADRVNRLISSLFFLRFSRFHLVFLFNLILHSICFPVIVNSLVNLTPIQTDIYEHFV
jgi:hypothetical protein